MVTKKGYQGTISKRDHSDEVIVSPSSAELFPYIYKKCYALRLEK